MKLNSDPNTWLINFWKYNNRPELGEYKIIYSYTYEGNTLHTEIPIFTNTIDQLQKTTYL